MTFSELQAKWQRFKDRVNKFWYDDPRWKGYHKRPRKVFLGRIVPSDRDAGIEGTD